MPQISVVIASKVGAPFIDQCLESIRDEAARLDAEVLVVTPRSEEYADRIRDRFPWVRVIRDPALTQVPALRRRGVDEASGECVAIIEEHCSAAPDWLHPTRAARGGKFLSVK
jgi:glycosyltransferase involved in cell wall biosynthesis